MSTKEENVDIESEDNGGHTIYGLGNGEVRLTQKNGRPYIRIYKNGYHWGFTAGMLQQMIDKINEGFSVGTTIRDTGDHNYKVTKHSDHTIEITAPCGEKQTFNRSELTKMMEL